ncbi:MAG: PorV/PorQ family protein [Elusimicrobia bacterium]|nr:PorV/PorQ family protein [Elusimicrobiota bacterium]MBI3012660.1 PorV/PorQ family protein [Elusimicrobiota bacterium]
MNRKRSLTLVLTFLLCVDILNAFGRKTVGTTGAKFLRLGVNARAIAMGEAYTAVSDGSDSVYWNPAGLDRVEGNSISFMHASYLQTIAYDFASYAKRIGDAGTLGVGVQYVNVGSIDETNEFGVNVGQFQPSHMAVSIGWGSRFTRIIEKGGEGFSWGIAGKFIRSRIIETAVAGAADLGVGWHPTEESALSVSVQNIGSNLKFKDESDPLPIVVKVGSSYRIRQRLLLALDADFPRDNDPSGAFGLEYVKPISGEMWLAGRGGFNTTTITEISGLSSLSAGAGFGWRSYSIDFAWVPFGNLGNTYRVSLSAKF